jgi:hypothetical protein
MSDTNINLSRVEAKLDVLIRLTALSVAPEGLSLKERALRLQRAGMAPKDIASLVGTTSNAVRVALSGAKRKGKGKKAKNG